MSRFETSGRGEFRIVASKVKRGTTKPAPRAAGGPSLALVVAVALASAGVGYVASRVWPLPGSSGSAVQVPAGARKSGEPAPAPSASAKYAPAPPPAAPKFEPAQAVPSPPAAVEPVSQPAAAPAASLPAKPDTTAATPSEPLPTLALIPPSVAPPGTPPVEGTAPIEPPRTASQSAAGREEAGKQDTQPVIATPPAVNAAPPKAVNRPIPRQRAAQPAPAPAAPQSGYLNDKALRDFMSYPANGY